MLELVRPGRPESQRSVSVSSRGPCRRRALNRPTTLFSLDRTLPSSTGARGRVGDWEVTDPDLPTPDLTGDGRTPRGAPSSIVEVQGLVVKEKVVDSGPAHTRPPTDTQDTLIHDIHSSRYTQTQTTTQGPYGHRLHASHTGTHTHT